MFYGFGHVRMAVPLLSRSDLPVCYGDWAVSGGHIAGESHGLRHSPRALCVIDPDHAILDSLLRYRPAASSALWGLPLAPPPSQLGDTSVEDLPGKAYWRPAGDLCW